MPNIKNIDIPIILYAFTRPSILEQQINLLRSIKAKNVIFISDALKQEDMDTREKIDKLKLIANSKCLVDSVDWDCSVKKLYFTSNIGPTYCGYEGIKEAIKQHNKYILFDDDIIFNEDTIEYFSYCLEKYEYSQDIFTCVSSNLTDSDKNGYFFSDFFLPMWGFAGWKNKINNFFKWEKCLCLDKIKSILIKVNNSFLQEEFNYFKNNINNPHYYLGDVAMQLYCIDLQKKAILYSKSLVEYNGYDKMVRKNFLSLKSPEMILNITANKFLPFYLNENYAPLILQSFKQLKQEERK